MRKSLFLSVIIISMSAVLSCSDGDESDLNSVLRTTKSSYVDKFVVEGNVIRVDNPEDLPWVEKAVAKSIENCKVVVADFKDKGKKHLKSIPSLEKMAPSEGSSGGTTDPGVLPDLVCSLYVRPVYSYKGDPHVSMESYVEIIGPNVYRQTGWQVSRNDASWLDRNTKVKYNIKGTLHAIYRYSTKSPSTKRDTIITKKVERIIEDEGIYIVN